MAKKKKTAKKGEEDGRSRHADRRSDLVELTHGKRIWRKLIFAIEYGSKSPFGSGPGLPRMPSCVRMSVILHVH